MDYELRAEFLANLNKTEEDIKKNKTGQFVILTSFNGMKTKLYLPKHLQYE